MPTVWWISRRGRKNSLVRKTKTLAEKGDTDQTTSLQKENRNLVEKVERLGQEYNKLRKASEFIMSVVEGMDIEDLKQRIFEKRKKELSIPSNPSPC